MDVDKDSFFQRAKSQIRIIHIPGYTKMTKSDRFVRVEIFILFITTFFKCMIFLFFLRGPEYKVFPS